LTIAAALAGAGSYAGLQANLLSVCEFAGELPIVAAWSMAAKVAEIGL